MHRFKCSSQAAKEVQDARNNAVIVLFPEMMVAPVVYPLELARQRARERVG